MSQTVSLSLVRPGMRLAEDLCDSTGKPLAPRGTVLGEALLTLARDRGIESLVVEVATGVKLSSGATHQRLHHLFRRVGNDAWSQALLRTLIEYREEQPK